MKQKLDLTIRRVSPDDVDAIARLDAKLTGIAKAAHWRDQVKLAKKAPLERPFLVAEVAGELVAFATGEVRAWEFGSPPCGWVFAIEVNPKSRVAGLGSMLLTAIRAEFKRAGVERVRTMVARDDSLVMSFFRSQGMMAGPFVQLEMGVDE